MTRLFRSAAAYVQGPDVLDAAGAHLEAIDGERSVLIGGDTALSVVEDRLRDGLEGAGIPVAAVERGVAACTAAVVDDGSALAREAGADVVVGVGGGTAIDAAKAVAGETDAAFVSVPTVASTDAPASAVSVIYDDAGRPVGSVLRDRNPELVLVDTAVVAAAPARFLRHGIGDAIATRFEAEAAARADGVTIHGTQPTAAGLAAARECFEQLDRHGSDALDDAAAGTVTPAVEAVVEANLLLSGLGFENGGLAAAHAMESGLRTAGTPLAHGDAVAFSTLAQLALEDHEELASLRDLLVDLGLTATLADLGVEDDLDRIAEVACARDIVANEPVAVTEAAVIDALRRADALLSG